MVVTHETFKAVIKSLLLPMRRAVDTETTGLKSYDKHELFSLIVASDTEKFYFNFNDKPDHLGKLPPREMILPRKWLKEFEPVFENQDSSWFAHNAKFDLGMLAREGLWLAGDVHCTEAVARLLRSDFQKYNLEICIERMCKELKLPNMAKDDAVKAYIKEHKLFTEVHVEGKSKPIEEHHYELVPFELIVPYGLNDGAITQKLGCYQESKVLTLVNKDPAFGKLVANEKKLTKTSLKMMRAGIPYNASTVDRCMKEELAKIEMIQKEYKGHTGNDFVDSGVQFAEFFEKEKIPFKRTDKGNPRFDEYALETMPAHPVVDLIKSHRDSQKKVSTYYSSFAYYGANGRIHADMRQAGTGTGRVSYREPNMQNVPKRADSGSETPIRSIFEPPPEHCFFMPDYDQMEYRMMLDDAEEHGVIDLILKDNLDVHTATAQMMGIDERDTAKTINFLLLYGGGDQKLANTLGCSLMRAKELKARYFFKLPAVKAWSKKTIFRAGIQGAVRNWAGRICHISKAYSYKAPNYKIQGGGADVVKFAMNKCDDLLVGKKSQLSLQIHDELLFMLHETELDLAPKIVEIMENIYPYKRLPLTVGASFSWENWKNKVDGLPEMRVSA